MVGQFANTAGGRISLPPSWAMGMKYDPAEGGDNATFVKTVIEEFAARGIRPDRAILEPAWQGTQYNWNTAKFRRASSQLCPQHTRTHTHTCARPAATAGCVRCALLDARS